MSGKSNKADKCMGTSAQTDPIQAAIECGIDVTMLIDNLQRSVTERIKRHQMALNTVRKFQKAKRL